MSAENKSAHPLHRLKSSVKELRDRHRDRHRPSGFGFVFADRIDYLDPLRWDSITSGGSLFLKRDVLRVIEQYGPENIQARYSIIFRGDKAVAAVSAQIVRVTGERFNTKPKPDKAHLPTVVLRRVFSPAVKVATANLRERLIIAGNLLSWGFHGIAFLPGEDPVELWPAVAESLYRIRRAERLAGQTNFVMVKDVTARETGLSALHRFSYRAVETEPNMVLRIDPAWRNYDDYLTALDAKYRRNAKDQMKKLAAAGCSIEPLLNVDAHSTRLHELYLAVHKNASVRLVTLPPGFLPALAAVMKEDFRCTVVRRSGEIVGFVTSIRDGDTAIAYYIGFDKDAAAEGLPIYLRLLHATVGDAISWRCSTLSLGRTALDPKASLGAKPEAMSVWLRHRVPAMNWVLRGLLGGIPHAEAPERNPFKSTTPSAPQSSRTSTPGADTPSVSI